ncbi:MAG TPA: WGxxGxxG family protein [Telluria sp.]
MKKAYTFAGRTVVALSMSLACAMPVLAQNTTAADTATSTTANGATTTQVTTREEEHDRDYGWIGLLGLAGLLGLRRKHETHRPEANRTTTSTHPR